jgi:signal peptidase
MLPGSHCDGWSHPFERTLHDGDLVVLQGVSPKDIKIGDIIVYRKPNGVFVIHRVISNTTGTDGKLYFTTKGDGNDYSDSPQVSQDDVIGRVILRIPWLGHIALIMHNSFAAFIIIAIIILLIFELVIPLIIGEKGEKTENAQGKNAEKASET